MKLSDTFEAEAKKCEERIAKCETEGHMFSVCARDHNQAVINVWRAAAKIAREAGQ